MLQPLFEFHTRQLFLQSNYTTVTTLLQASGPVANGRVSGVKPQNDFSGDIFWLTSSYNAPKCIISTPKPHKLQSVAKRLIILSLSFYLYKIQ